jgi:diaminohydroxyphosphoribosylaminopyrimidine deaminase/5-amino-6-(5-phosphoribosylamino)uracil reductase
VRIIVDSHLRTPVTAKVLPKKQGPRTIIATTGSATAERAEALETAGAEVWRLPTVAGRVSLAALAMRLGEESLHAVLVEGGGQMHASLLAAGLATDLQLFIAPKIVGGPAPTWVGGQGLARLADAHPFRFVGAPRQIGDDLLVRAVALPPA